MADKRWIAETLFDELGFRMSYEVKKVLYELQTEHQHLVLFEHPFFGKMLMLDGATQITKKDEFIYQEMMSHVPLFAHGNARDVLIIGGGDCGIAEEVLKHKAVERLTQVEIDPAVVEFSKEHFPEFTKPVFADKRFESVIDDGMKYVARTERRFDAIIVDSTVPQGPGKVLFSQKFYAACKRCMNDGAVMVTQNGVPIFQPGELTSSVAKFRKLFADGTCYVAAIPTYVGGHMAMGWATDNAKLRQAPAKTIAERYRKAGSFKTRYWTPEVHTAAFALPRFIAETVAKGSAGAVSDAAPAPERWPARRLARLGCLLPVLALIVFLLVFLAWPVERHRDASDFHTAMFFLTLALVPIAALAGIVLAIMAVVRARRERRGGGMLVRPAVAILSAIFCVGLLVLVIWAALTGLARFR